MLDHLEFIALLNLSHPADVNNIQEDEWQSYANKILETLLPGWDDKQVHEYHKYQDLQRELSQKGKTIPDYTSMLLDEVKNFINLKKDLNNVDQQLHQAASQQLQNLRQRVQQLEREISVQQGQLEAKREGLQQLETDGGKLGVTQALGPIEQLAQQERKEVSPDEVKLEYQKKIAQIERDINQMRGA